MAIFHDGPEGTVELVAITTAMVDGKRVKVGQARGTKPNSPQLAVSRIVALKSNPSRHECDARCMNASGRQMACECACGGKNHGKGSR